MPIARRAIAACVVLLSSYDDYLVLSWLHRGPPTPDDGHRDVHRHTSPNSSPHFRFRYARSTPALPCPWRSALRQVRTYKRSSMLATPRASHTPRSSSSSPIARPHTGSPVLRQPTPRSRRPILDSHRSCVTTRARRAPTMIWRSPKRCSRCARMWWCSRVGCTSSARDFWR